RLLSAISKRDISIIRSTEFQPRIKLRAMRLHPFIAIVGIAVSAHVHAQATVAGSTPGGFRITETGAAEYRVPIRVPPGMAGVEPKLSLAYNSQGGSGFVGL